MKRSEMVCKNCIHYGVNKEGTVKARVFCTLHPKIYSSEGFWVFPKMHPYEHCGDGKWQNPKWTPTCELTHSCLHSSGNLTLQSTISRYLYWGEWEEGKENET